VQLSAPSPVVLVASALFALTATELIGCSSGFDECGSTGKCNAPAGGTAGEQSVPAGAGAGGKGGAGKGGAPSSAGGKSGDAGDGGREANAGNAGAPGGRSAAAGRGGDAGRAGAGNVGNAGGEGGEAGADSAGGEAGMTGPVIDTEPPYVVSVFPEDGALGVRADTDIVITFNEPMDRVEAEKAYESVELPPSSVTFSWSGGGTVLTVHPEEPLVYAMAGFADVGTPGAAAKSYAMAMTTVARDEAGNRLAEERAFSFKTLRKVPQVLTIADTRRVRHEEGEPDRFLTGCASNTEMHVGDGNSNVGYAFLVSFSTSLVPGYELPEDLLEAQLSFTTTTVPTVLGALRAYRVRLSDLDAATWAMPVESELALMGIGSSLTTADAKAGFLADVAKRDDGMTQYFIRFTLPTNGDDVEHTVTIPCSSVRFTATYLAP
jgi:hypothetical protein